MRETLEIGSSPCDEDCAQVGSDNYEMRAMKECRQFIIAIKRTLGEPPKGASLRIKANSHDFGTYYEVAVAFDCNDEKASEYAYNCESGSPATWTEEDRLALGIDTEHVKFSKPFKRDEGVFPNIAMASENR